jgi:hypothetical protein
MIGYPIFTQLKDLLPTILFALILVVLTYGVNQMVPTHMLVSLLLKTGIFALYIPVTGIAFKITEYKEIKDIVIEQFKYVLSSVKIHKS